MLIIITIIVCAAGISAQIMYQALVQVDTEVAKDEGHKLKKQSEIFLDNNKWWFIYWLGFIFFYSSMISLIYAIYNSIIS